MLFSFSTLYIVPESSHHAKRLLFPRKSAKTCKVCIKVNSNKKFTLLLDRDVWARWFIEAPEWKLNFFLSCGRKGKIVWGCFTYSTILQYILIWISQLCSTHQLIMIYGHHGLCWIWKCGACDHKKVTASTWET